MLCLRGGLSGVDGGDGLRVARDGRGLPGVVVRGLVLPQLPLVSVAAGADGADEGLLTGVDSNVGDVPLAPEESLAASFAPASSMENTVKYMYMLVRGNGKSVSIADTNHLYT